MALHTQNARSRRCYAVSMTDIVYAGDLALLTTTLTKAESLLHGSKQRVAGIGLYANAKKTEFMSFK